MRETIESTVKQEESEFIEMLGKICGEAECGTVWCLAAINNVAIKTGEVEALCHTLKHERTNIFLH